MCEFTDANGDRQAICLPRRLVISDGSPEHDLLSQTRRSSLEMKTTLVAVLVSLLLAAGSGSAQNPVAQDEQRLLNLVKEIQAQQAQIAANQEKLDSKMGEVSEAVRLARIFAGRGGK